MFSDLRANWSKLGICQIESHRRRLKREEERENGQLASTSTCFPQSLSLLGVCEYAEFAEDHSPGRPAAFLWDPTDLTILA